MRILPVFSKPGILSEPEMRVIEMIKDDERQYVPSAFISFLHPYHRFGQPLTTEAARGPKASEWPPPPFGFFRFVQRKFHEIFHQRLAMGGAFSE